MITTRWATPAAAARTLHSTATSAVPPTWQSEVMTDPGKSKAERVQDEANEMGVTEDDEREAKKRFDETGEPVRDNLGNQEGAS